MSTKTPNSELAKATGLGEDGRYREGQAALVERVDDFGRKGRFFDATPWRAGYIRAEGAIGAVVLRDGLMLDIKTGRVYGDARFMEGGRTVTVAYGGEKTLHEDRGAQVVRFELRQIATRNGGHDASTGSGYLLSGGVYFEFAFMESAQAANFEDAVRRYGNPSVRLHESRAQSLGDDEQEEQRGVTR